MIFVIINHHNSWFAEDCISSKNLNELYFLSLLHYPFLIIKQRNNE